MEIGNVLKIEKDTRLTKYRGPWLWTGGKKPERRKSLWDLKPPCLPLANAEK